MALTSKSPAPGDSDNVLMWKYAVNMTVLAGAAVSEPEAPKLGSTDNGQLAKALTAIIAFS